jgi:murein DD-endopeptidase MepM/ murein hydrolase activator NlpD
MKGDKSPKIRNFLLGENNMPRFPLPIVPTQSYHQGGLRFGAKRKKDDGTVRTHAGCDLLAPVGTEVYAIDYGIVLDVPKTPFIPNTKLYSVIIEHANYIVRYTEVSQNVADGIYPGATVHEGQLISTLEKNNKGGAMLHFEMYNKDASGYLSQKNNTTYLYVPSDGIYQRRKDLLDPTNYLDTLRFWTQF